MKRRTLLTVAATLVVVAVVAIGFWWWQKTLWPSFPPAPAAAAGEPQVTVQLPYKRDYGYRIGDAIFVDIYIKHSQEITVSPASLAIGEDFEAMEAPLIEEQQLPDGGGVIQRIRLKVQSFKMKPDLVLDGTLGYNRDGVRQELKIPAQHLFTSKTYDGREQLQEGDDVRVSFLWYGGRHIVPLAFGSLAFLAMCALALRNRSRQQAVSPARLGNHQRERAQALLATIRDGNGTSAAHAELEALVRARWNLGPTITAALMTEAQHGADLIKFMRLNSVALYSSKKLRKDRLARLCELGDGLVRGWNKVAD